MPSSGDDEIRTRIVRYLRSDRPMTFATPAGTKLRLYQIPTGTLETGILPLDDAPLQCGTHAPAENRTRSFPLATEWFAVSLLTRGW